MNLEELKQEINNLSKEDIGEIADFSSELYDSLGDEE